MDFAVIRCQGNSGDPRCLKNPVTFINVSRYTLGLAVKRITLFQEGTNIKTVQAIAGHASIEMTRRYIHEMFQ